MCFCDADEKKQGTWYIGLPVHSFEQVQKKYDGRAVFYITLSIPLRYDVQEHLISLGIDKGRIINYEPVCKYKSCNYLKTWIGVGDYSIVSCCQSGEVPQILWSDTDNTIDGAITAYLNMRDRTIEAIKNDESTLCDGCHCIEERYWPVKEKIDLVRFHAQLQCQLSCNYCHVVNASNPMSEHTKKFIDWFNLEEFVKQLENRELLSENTNAIVSPGEITIHPRKNEYYDALSNFKMCIFTNAVVFDDRIVELTARGRGSICVSIDAGTRETYLKIKGKDYYSRVWQNLKEYAKQGVQVVAKYVFIPENSDIENVDGFLNEAVKAGVQGIDVSADYFRKEQFSDEQIRIIVRMIIMAECYGFDYINISIGENDVFISDDSARIDEFYKYAKKNLGVIMHNA